MRILLINAPSRYGPDFPIPSVIRDKGKDMPLGLMYLGASLKHHGFDGVQILDAHTLNLGPIQTAKKIIKHKPELLCATVYSFSCFDLWLCIKRIKSGLPDCKIALGGPHVTRYPEESLKGLKADFICAGYGEQAAVEIADAIKEGRKPNSVPGIGYFDNQNFKFTPPAKRLPELDSLPFPDRTLIRANEYTSWVTDRPMPTTAMITSRGCPYGCVFCAQSQTAFAQRSVNNVIDEIRECVDAGYRMINFEDDCMNRSREWMEKFAERMLELENPPSWGFRGRAENFDLDLANLLAKAGCKRVNFGVESGDDNVQRQIGKQLSVDKAEHAIQAAKKAGIATVCYFMFGFPEETKQQMEKTVQFAIKTRPDYAQFTPLVLLPGTPLYRREQKLKGKGYDPYQDFTLCPNLAFLPPPISGTLPQEYIYKTARWAYFRYYFSLKFLFSGKGAAGGILRGLAAGFSLLKYIFIGPGGNKGSLEKSRNISEQ